MAEPRPRRGHGKDAIYFAADKNRFIGAVSVEFGPDGKRLRRKVSGKTKQEVRDKLRTLHAELDVGLQSSAGYTVRAAVDDWLEHGLSGRSARTVRLYRDGVRPLTDRLGARPLRKLSAADVRSALAVLSEQLSTRSLQIAHNCLVRAIRHAESNDLVGRNVAALIRPPAGHEGRPSKALSVEQAQKLLRVAAEKRPGGAPHPLHAYMVLLLTTGLRPEEAPSAALGSRRPRRGDGRGLALGPCWRRHQTPKSRRTLPLVQIAVDALRQRKAAQAADHLKASELWHDTGLVFTTTIGTMFDQHNIRRGFRQITRAAGLGDDWVPRELRHTFVSIMFRRRRPGWGDRPPRRPPADERHRVGLPPRVAPSNRHWR
jgi:site-specific recombinase XerD